MVSLIGTGFTASFQYDASGRRVGKTINGKTQTYLYDGADIIQESGTKTASYTQGTGIDEPLLRRAGNQREYYLADALGSIVGLTDESAAITTSYSYSPYGKKATAGFASDNPYGFTAREDDGTGLYFYRARYYSPEQKRFISEDPIGFESGDVNFYAYVGGNPVIFRDAFGKQQAELDGYQKREQQGMRANYDLLKTYDEMKNKNVSGSDQFFHCVAACRARKSSGLSPEDIKGRLATKEYLWDYPRNLLGLYGGKKRSHSEMIEDISKDLAANALGANCPDQKPCNKQCLPLLPESAGEYMQEYIKE